MRVSIAAAGTGVFLEPLTCKRAALDLQVGGGTLRDVLEARLAPCAKADGEERALCVSSKLWPSKELVAAIAASAGEDLLVISKDGEALAWASRDGSLPAKAKSIELDAKSKLVVYPWDLLAVNEDIVGALDADDIKGTVRERVTIDGHIVLGEGSVILPGVYIEGNVVIGRNSKIGPNCYIRGSTFIGDGCHVGQAVEIKNSILMDKVAAGHLSYIGDSVVCQKTNFGAGTITSNFRHDGKSHRSMVGDKLVDTGRRKFGAIIGENVHTGIHTSIYPGRKIWADVSTRPGDIVQRDLLSQAQD